MIPKGGKYGSILARIVYGVIWFLCLGFLVCPSWAQKCSGLSRGVLLMGLTSLFLAWPKNWSLKQQAGAFLGLVPVLALALALDVQSGLLGDRAYGLVGHGCVLCFASMALGSRSQDRWRNAQGALFALWFLAPIALGMWSHTASESPLEPGRTLAWSPLGSFWQELPLLRGGASGLELQRNLVLILVALIYLVVNRGQWSGAREVSL